VEGYVFKHLGDLEQILPWVAVVAMFVFTALFPSQRFPRLKYGVWCVFTVLVLARFGKLA
jgi:hypothetical protein